MPFTHHTDERAKHAHHLPHIGMRKIKSVLAVFVGFWIWQGLRLLIPGLEVHPLFIYIYGLIEIRETSDKTMDYGRMRVLVTLIAIFVGLPFMLLTLAAMVRTVQVLMRRAQRMQTENDLTV